MSQKKRKRDNDGTGGAKMKSKPKSLTEFVLHKKRVGCKVCQLSPAIIEEIKGARTKKIGRPIILEWLQREHGIKLMGAELDTHYSGRHENGSPA